MSVWMFVCVKEIVWVVGVKQRDRKKYIYVNNINNILMADWNKVVQEIWSPPTTIISPMPIHEVIPEEDLLIETLKTCKIVWLGLFNYSLSHNLHFISIMMCVHWKHRTTDTNIKHFIECANMKKDQLMALKSGSSLEKEFKIFIFLLWFMGLMNSSPKRQKSFA
jgi:hypothetical protein